MKTNEFYFVVEGSGEFPYDMLRYDECWPYYGEDASLMGRHAPLARRRIVLMHRASNSHWRPTVERWASFGWRVADIASYPLHNRGEVK